VLQCCHFQRRRQRCRKRRRPRPTACSQSGSAGCARGSRVEAWPQVAVPTGSTSRARCRHSWARLCCSRERWCPCCGCPCRQRSKRCPASRCCRPTRPGRREPRELSSAVRRVWKKRSTRTRIRRCSKNWWIRSAPDFRKREDPFRPPQPKKCWSEEAGWLPESENCFPKERKVGCCLSSCRMDCHSEPHLLETIPALLVMVVTYST